MKTIRTLFIVGLLAVVPLIVGGCASIDNQDRRDQHRSEPASSGDEVITIPKSDNDNDDMERLD